MIVDVFRRFHQLPWPGRNVTVGSTSVITIFRQLCRRASTNSPHRARERRDALKWWDLYLPLSSLHKGACRLNPETQPSASPHCVKIETENRQSATFPAARFTPTQLGSLLHS